MPRYIFALVFFLLSVAGGYAQPPAVPTLLKELEQTEDPEGKIKVLNNLVRELASSDPPASIRYGLQAVELATAAGNKLLLANAYHNLGAAYQLKGNYRTAADLNFKALKIREEIGDSLGISTSYNNIGNINSYLKQYSKALECYEKSYTIASKIKDKQAISRALNNLGNHYEVQGNTALSLKYYEQALPIKEEIGDKNGIMISLINIGDLLVKSGKIKKGISYLDRVVVMARETHNQSNLCYAYQGLAEAYQKLGNLNKAAAFGLKSLDIALKQHTSYEINSVAQVLNSIYVEQEDYTNAHRYLTLAMAYKDSLYKESSHQEASELQVKYETEKKEKENIQLLSEKALQEKVLRNQKKIIYLIAALMVSFAALAIVLFKGKQHFQLLNERLARKNHKILRSRKKLKQQQKILSQQTERFREQKELLEKTNTVKDRLFSVVAHDLRAPLISLGSMTSLLRKGAISESRKEHFLDLLDAEQQNSLWLLDNLFVWAKAQMNGTQTEPSPLNLHQLTEENINLLHLQAEKKLIHIQNNISPTQQICADPETVKLVLRNLLANAIKFCNMGDEIVVSATQQEDYVEVSVADTGIGIPDDVKEKLFKGNITSRGTANEKGSGLGLQLCKDFIQMNGGTIWAESEVGKGSNFKFTLPAFSGKMQLQDQSEFVESMV